MRTTLPLESYVVHALPGRVRIHIPRWSARQQDSLERQLRHLPGVTSAQANPLTGNVLLRFDPLVTTATRLLAATRAIPVDDAAGDAADGERRAGDPHDRRAQEDRLPASAAFSPIPARTPAPAPTQPAPAHAVLAHTGQRVAPQTRGWRREGALEAREAREAREMEETQELQEIVARLQVWKLLNFASEGSPSPEAAAVVRPTLSLAERSADRSAEQTTAQATRFEASRQSAATAGSAQRASLLSLLSLLRRMLRAFFAPGVPMLALKAVSVIFGLARASSPLGLALGGFELAQTLAEVYARRSAFTSLSSVSGARSAHVCAQCGAAC